MAVTTINLRVAPYRLFTKAEAAHYCRRSPAKFEAQCPVTQIIMADGDRLWDVLDLDKWIDSLKEPKSSDADAIVARLR
ncbi:MAG TPA: hypothetical protein VGP28_01380 [Methylocella sp.]|nr:hypothetical protein [Methylocella sp.]